jgi:macrolide-specific efflux system membrane fusion protein
MIRRFSGQVEAATTARLSFEVSGSLREVKVDAGDRIHPGQVPAVVDDEAYRYKSEAAEANRGRA